MGNQSNSVTDILDTLKDLADDEKNVQLGDVTDAIGGRGFGPLIVVPSILVISPLGGIPVFPSLMALVIAIVAAQVALRRDNLWLPAFMKKRSVENDRVKKAVNKIRPLARWLDKHMGHRLTALTGKTMEMVVAGVIVLLCLAVPPSEVIPFAAILPMSAICALGLALTVKDGLVMLLGLIAAGLAIWGIFLWVL